MQDRIKGDQIMQNVQNVQNKNGAKTVGWVFFVMGLLYLINPFDIPGPIDDAFAVSAGTIIKVVCDYISTSAAKQIAVRQQKNNFVDV